MTDPLAFNDNSSLFPFRHHFGTLFRRPQLPRVISTSQMVSRDKSYGLVYPVVQTKTRNIRAGKPLVPKNPTCVKNNLIAIKIYEVIIRKASTRVEMRVCQCTRFSLGSRWYPLSSL